MPLFQFSSTINETYYNVLEKLFYFNSGQFRYYDRIVEVVEAFGQPKIECRDGMLTMTVESLPECLNLFASHSNSVVGVMIYFKESETIMNILHIAVDTAFSAKGEQSVISAMMEEMQRIAHQDTGITHLKISYTRRLFKIVKDE